MDTRHSNMFSGNPEQALGYPSGVMIDKSATIIERG